MGWMTWERFRCEIDCDADPDNCISEQLIKSHADILAAPEWRSLGYQYINIDDCWANWNRTGGKLVANTSRFPSGMKSLGDYVHGKGLNWGRTTTWARSRAASTRASAPTRSARCPAT